MENRAKQSEQDVGQRYFMWFPGTRSVQRKLVLGKPVLVRIRCASSIIAQFGDVVFFTE